MAADGGEAGEREEPPAGTAGDRGDDRVLSQGAGGPGEPPRGRRWRRRVARSLASILVLLLAFYGGVLFQFHLGPQFDSQVPSALLLTRPAKGLDFGTLQQIYDTMSRQYVRDEISPDDAFNGAAKGMVQLYLNNKFGDAFSTYYTPDELQRNREFLRGSFGGIGATMGNRDGKLAIIKILPGTPAQSSGLQVGDIVTRIDGASTDGQTVDWAVAKIRGPVGSHVKLTIQRNGQTVDVDIVRNNITIPSVRSKEIAPKVLYVRIYDFGSSTAQDFESALKQGLAKGDDKIVLDLRQNPGGYVSAADSVVSEFVQQGTTVVVVGRDNARDEHKVTGSGIAFSQKLTVLVDENTASAAEITSGALEDNHRATLVGKKTFGKGLVEDDFPLRNGGSLHLTIAYWLRPNGQSIDKNGITPDRVVALDKPESFWDIDTPTSDPSKDAQFQAALAALK